MPEGGRHQAVGVLQCVRLDLILSHVLQPAAYGLRKDPSSFDSSMKPSDLSAEIVSKSFFPCVFLRIS